MELESLNPIRITQILIAFAVLIQSAELLWLRAQFGADGVWTWSILKDESSHFPAPIRALLNNCLDYPGFLILLWIQFLSACALLKLPAPLLSLLMLLNQILICFRFRGTFNGGSDYMTIVILSALCVQSCFANSELIALACLWYIALQVTASYFLAGVAKLKAASWRNGEALEAFLLSAPYSQADWLMRALARPSARRALAWGVLTFECSFPLALFSVELCFAYIALAFLFHLGNVYLLGLNRFLWAWASAYPALVFCSSIA